ncbi:unnamed protein product [Rotaria sp. Silwood1]|nr:unnamed protein product [Rotaria sp. Silwood1]CAF1351650.1 unnamed protein product [Rotaria sp. Silwood1]CAF1585283.1 unnamed protein product [Rotaria sp. Silwood1]CAF1647892.1 unnamed protein product [Rotaria sp. Silwood1]CAF3804776.1 unnamed protein product [Rotaria sp. Silwood1]
MILINLTVDEDKREYLKVYYGMDSNLESTDDQPLDEFNKQLINEEYFSVAPRLYHRTIEENQYLQTIQIDNHLL